MADDDPLKPAASKRQRGKAPRNAPITGAAKGVKRELRWPEWIMAGFTVVIACAAIAQCHEMSTGGADTKRLADATKNLALAASDQASDTASLAKAASDQAASMSSMAASQSSQLDQLRASVSAAQASANAAQTAAHAAKVQAALAQRGFDQLDRPRILSTERDTKLGDSPRRAAILDTTVVLGNYGRGPAVVQSGVFLMSWGEAMIPPSEILAVLDCVAVTQAPAPNFGPQDAPIAGKKSPAVLSWEKQLDDCYGKTSGAVPFGEMVLPINASTPTEVARMSLEDIWAFGDTWTNRKRFYLYGLVNYSDSAGRHWQYGIGRGYMPHKNYFEEAGGNAYNFDRPAK